ncbi:hypothetical protein V6N13_087827 [Hibiscus sabdariffa]|uniref:Uncharacterized protein n=1 Tax=Hibiscus sabdariffa TaxID=183260 RepID=A0ABR2FXF3_9ROSI
MTTLTFDESWQMKIINNINQLNPLNNRKGTKENEKALAQQARGREAPIEQLNPLDLEELDSRYAEFVNELYITGSKKITTSTSMPIPKDAA